MVFVVIVVIVVLVVLVVLVVIVVFTIRRIFLGYLTKRSNTALLTIINKTLLIRLRKTSWKQLNSKYWKWRSAGDTHFQYFELFLRSHA